MIDTNLNQGMNGYAGPAGSIDHTTGTYIPYAPNGTTGDSVFDGMFSSPHVNSVTFSKPCIICDSPIEFNDPQQPAPLVCDSCKEAIKRLKKAKIRIKKRNGKK